MNEEEPKETHMQYTVINVSSLQTILDTVFIH